MFAKICLGALQVLEYASTISAGSVLPPNDFGMVASIDGRKLSSLDLPVNSLLTAASGSEAYTIANCKCTAPNGLSYHGAPIQNYRCCAVKIRYPLGRPFTARPLCIRA